MRQHEQIVPSLPRTSNSKIIPTNYIRSTSSSSDDFHRRPLIRRPAAALNCGVSTFLRSLLSIFTFSSLLPTCRFLHIHTQFPSLRRKVTGTLFGHRRGHVSFAVQDDPRSEPIVLIELAISTSALVKEMSSGLVRIALECEKRAAPSRRLLSEAAWTMYCNGRKSGYAVARECTESDWHVLRTVERVSIGAGVIPVVEDGRKNSTAAEGELLYMRARFERVVGSADSQAFYMLNPDGNNGGPDLSIFFLRI